MRLSISAPLVALALCLSPVLALPSSSNSHSHIAKRGLPASSGFDYANDKVRGVNLGNWLLIEPWMSPELTAQLNSIATARPQSMSSIPDEWSAALYSNSSQFTQVLNTHLSSWIVEDDFRQIAAAGLNHVRIPVPHWALGTDVMAPGEPYIAGNRWATLKQGVMWAKQYGLKVWIDLHSVPGSQNGYDNSGHAIGYPGWADSPSYLNLTQIALTRLITEFAHQKYAGTVTAIEPVNEPWGAQDPDIQDLLDVYYPWARTAIARPLNNKGKKASKASSIMMATHNGFWGVSGNNYPWADFFTGTAKKRVIMDSHPYYIYSSAEQKMKDSARLTEVCANQAEFAASHAYYPTVAGEWAPNGPHGDLNSDRDTPMGPRTFPKNATSPYSVKYMNFLSRNFATQQQVYEKGAGWIMWTWKITSYLDWSYQAGLQYGWIPMNLDSNAALYGDACANYTSAASRLDYQPSSRKAGQAMAPYPDIRKN